VTCEALQHSNVEVIVASYNPRVVDVGGSRVRKMETDCWFFIGPTNTKHKEADSHFHDAAMWTVLVFYLVDLPLLCWIFLETDGCAGQYKGECIFLLPFGGGGGGRAAAWGMGPWAPAEPISPYGAHMGDPRCGVEEAVVHNAMLPPTLRAHIARPYG
jgi:hypothetical protein